MASERAIVFGRCGSITSVSFFTACAIGRASGCLRAEEADRLILNKSKLNQLVERLANLRNQRTARHWDNHVIRQPPSQLLGNLKPNCLRPLGIVGTQIHIHKSPVIAIGDLRRKGG